MREKVDDGDFESLRAVLNRNADVFSKHKADIGCCNLVKHEIELEEGANPHREDARRMTPHKSEACRAEIELLLEYDMIEPSKSPWACGVVIAKFFTTLDLGSAFWQVPLRKKDREKTGFACELGLYQWKRMPLACATPGQLFKD